MRVGSDTGGTFTDVVTADGRVCKVPSTPHDPSRAVAAAAALDAGEGARVEHLAHGTTVATNALLERRVAPVALVATVGFADVIEIARQDRPALYDHFVDRPEPLVARERRFEVRERLDATGAVLVAPDDDALRLLGLQLLDAGVLGSAAEAVAVCLLHADLSPVHELAVRDALAPLGLDVTCSHEISPVVREYERTVTTVANAALRPLVRRYLAALRELADEVGVVSSAGALMAADDAAAWPVLLVLSGPAAGVWAAAASALANDEPDAITFDMGGTSTDVCLVLGGAPAPAAARTVAGLPLTVASLDVHTIGAGGGSIARVDAGGALAVGPASAGSVPGPACYGRGGTAPTVTDADLVLGRLPAGVPLPGLGVLDVAAARAALAGAGVDAAGVVAVVDAAMEQALRAVSVARGVDPRGLALVAYGGAGPVHAAALAESLGMRRVLVPADAGVLCAIGALGAPLRRDLARSWPTPGEHDGLAEALEALAAQARSLIEGEVGFASVVEVTTSIDCRYPGQSHELTVAEVDDFHDEHELRNGTARPGDPVEVVTLRASATRRSPVVGWTPSDPTGGLGALGVAAGGRLVGPVAVPRPDCTVWVPEGWSARVGAAGALVLERVS